MERKKPLASFSLLTVLLVSIALIPSASSQGPSENHRYSVTYGYAKGCSDLIEQPSTVDWKTPYQSRPPYFMPFASEQNITFSEAWFYNATYGWLVNITVPHQTYVGMEHSWFDTQSSKWYRLVVTLEHDSYGWVFLNASMGDVDCYTYNDDDGVWWHTPTGMSSTGPDSHAIPAPTGASPKTGQKAANTGELPDVGPDGVGGTADDGFGNGIADPRGSSILLLNSTMHVDFWDGDSWELLFESPWPQVLTTETAYDIVLETNPAPGTTTGTDNNELYGWNSTETGQPWEFYAGLDHSGWQVPYDDPKWNAYVTYVCAWSVIDQPTALGSLDVIFEIKETKVREYWNEYLSPEPGLTVITDINCDEIVDIFDVVICAAAFGAEDEHAPDNPVADANYDARGDVRPNGLVDIFDFVPIAADFGLKLTPTCIHY